MTMRLTDEQWDWLCSRVPDAPVSPKGGRPAMSKRDAIRGIFRILDNGAKWKNLPRCFGSKSAVHRWFTTWVKAGVFERIMRDAGRLVEDRGEYRLYECFIDATFSKAKGGGDRIGSHQGRKGREDHGPGGCARPAGGRGLRVGDAARVQARAGLFGFILSADTPHRLIGDKAYDSDALDDQFACGGTDLIAPHRSSRRPENITQDGRYLRRYKRRWTVERTIAWFQNYRRLCIRWEKSATLFQGFLHLNCSLMLIRQVLG